MKHKFKVPVCLDGFNVNFYSRMNIQILHVSSRENASFSERKSFFLIRQQVSTLFYQLRQLIICENIHYEIVEAKIQPIAAYLDNLNALPIANVFHTVHSDKGNEVKYNELGQNN